MKRFVALMVLMVGLGSLAGCATEINGPAKLTGEDLSGAVALYGSWAEEIRYEGRPLYIWRRSLIVEGTPQFCELRVQLGFRQTIRRAYLEGFPAACRLFAVRYEPLTK